MAPSDRQLGDQRALRGVVLDRHNYLSLVGKGRNSSARLHCAGQLAT
jgi:hypothetical protein